LQHLDRETGWLRVTNFSGRVATPSRIVKIASMLQEEAIYHSDQRDGPLAAKPLVREARV
jgi:hypothetical protein